MSPIRAIKNSAVHVFRSSYVNFCLILIVVSFGCKSRGKPEPGGAMLDSGTGAVLVSFPAPDFFRRDDWMCQANLTGSIDTRMLPRLPFADLQSVLILDVPPGKYSAVAFAWQRGSDPQWGGSSDSVVVQSGRLTTLRARRFSGDPYPYNHTPLDLAEISLWKLPRQEDIHKYVASVLRETAKG